MSCSTAGAARQGWARHAVKQAGIDMKERVASTDHGNGKRIDWPTDVHHHQPGGQIAVCNSRCCGRTSSGGDRADRCGNCSTSWRGGVRLIPPPTRREGGPRITWIVEVIVLQNRPGLKKLHPPLAPLALRLLHMMMSWDTRRHWKEGAADEALVIVTNTCLLAPPPSTPSSHLVSGV